MQPDLASVYGLKDTRDKKVFYIGRTTDPYGRYGQHLKQASKDKTAKDKRILAMRKEGLMPELVIFEQDLPIGQGLTRERFWIRYHLDLGIDLTNAHLRHKKVSRDGKPGRTGSELAYALKWVPWSDAGFPIHECPWKNPWEMKKYRPKPGIEAKARAILGR